MAAVIKEKTGPGSYQREHGNNCFVKKHVDQIIPIFIYLLFYVAFNSQGHIAMGTVNHRASASNYQLSNIKHPARDSNQRTQRLEARTLTTTTPSPLNKANKCQLSS